VDSQRIEHIVKTYNVPAFRSKQIATAIFTQSIDSYGDITVLPQSLRQQLQHEPFLTIDAQQLQKSSEENAVKAAFKARKDGALFESVLLSPKPGLWSCCISSQVGCALGCTFCATGTMGLKRNLLSEEITDQVLFWRLYLAKNQPDATLSNVVYMGMGEPFHNPEEVFQSIEELINPRTFAIGARHISVSTSGLVPQIATFAERFPQVNLAISLHAPNDQLRSSLMPVNKRYDLKTLCQQLDTYVETTGRKLFVEYILLENENDQPQHASELVALIRGRKNSYLYHVNLIVYNKTESRHRESSRLQARQFKEILQKNGVSATIRKNLGRDIEGACGQLVKSESSLLAG